MSCSTQHQVTSNYFIPLSAWRGVKCLVCPQTFYFALHLSRSQAQQNINLACVLQHFAFCYGTTVHSSLLEYNEFAILCGGEVAMWGQGESMGGAILNSNNSFLVPQLMLRLMMQPVSVCFTWLFQFKGDVMKLQNQLLSYRLGVCCSTICCAVSLKYISQSAS